MFHPDVQRLYEQYVLADTHDTASQRQIERYLDTAGYALLADTDDIAGSFVPE